MSTMIDKNTQPNPEEVLMFREDTFKNTCILATIGVVVASPGIITILLFPENPKCLIGGFAYLLAALIVCCVAQPATTHQQE